MEKVALITGSSGFIGYHLSKKLLDQHFTVIGFDNMSDYYDVQLKQERQSRLETHKRFVPINDSLEKSSLLKILFETHKPDVVVHLAAQAGVRWSIENPRAYLDSNISGTFELLEAARYNTPKHMLIASTSSAYGANDKMPYSELDPCDHQMSFYAATKKSCENMAHSYAHLYDIPITMFRFFTVYGPWGRPDMALFKFTRAVLKGEPIDVYNFGNMKRDFTYIDDLVHAISLLLQAVPRRNAAQNPIPHDSISPVAPWRVVNIGNSMPVDVNALIAAVEEATGKIAQRNLMPLQPGDVPATWADTRLLKALTNYQTKTPVNEGVRKFVEWYKEYYSEK